MGQKILYLGDTSLQQQAAYLAGVMSHYHLEFDYLGSGEGFPGALLQQEYGLVIISDYPACNFNKNQMEQIAEKVKNGTGLLMVGGWESFTGSGGDYPDTPIADVLPVIMKSGDDRVNFSSPCLVIKRQDHEIVNALPFDQKIPAIGGLNAFDVKPNAVVLLSAVEFEAMKNGVFVEFKENRRYPLLVVGDDYHGRTAAFASDVAPHWVGPLVDWGTQRVKAQASGAEAIEVGNWYAVFFVNLIQWLCKK